MHAAEVVRTGVAEAVVIRIAERQWIHGRLYAVQPTTRAAERVLAK